MHREDSPEGQITNQMVKPPNHDDRRDGKRNCERGVKSLMRREKVTRWPGDDRAQAGTEYESCMV